MTDTTRTAGAPGIPEAPALGNMWNSLLMQHKRVGSGNTATIINGIYDALSQGGQLPRDLTSQVDVNIVPEGTDDSWLQLSQDARRKFMTLQLLCQDPHALGEHLPDEEIQTAFSRALGTARNLFRQYGITAPAGSGAHADSSSAAGRRGPLHQD